METIVISCPECSKQIKVPTTSVGKKIRCKGCEHVFAVKAPPTKAASKGGGGGSPPAPGAVKKSAPPAKPVKTTKPAKGMDEDEDSNPYGVTDTDTAHRCPQCAAELKGADAVICLGCGYNTRTREQVRTRKVRDVSGGDKFMWLLPGILCALSAVLLIGYCFFHHFALPGILVDTWDEMMERHESRLKVLKEEEIDFFIAAIIHPGVEVWLFVAAIFGAYKCGRFAYRRLVLHPEPPEIEKK